MSIYPHSKLKGVYANRSERLYIMPLKRTLYKYCLNPIIENSRRECSVLTNIYLYLYLVSQTLYRVKYTKNKIERMKQYLAERKLEKKKG